MKKNENRYKAGAQPKQKNKTTKPGAQKREEKCKEENRLSKSGSKLSKYKREGPRKSREIF